MHRPAIIPMFGFVFGLGIPIVLFFAALQFGWRFMMDYISIGAPFGAAFAFAWASLLHFLFPTRVSAEGILGYSFWGIRRFIAWEQISMARPFRLLNLRWVRLYSLVDGGATYVALFPADPDAFKADLHKFAPPLSPIFKYLY